ncbi:uncharacterized protein B0H18DRAFT_986605 [Fomitopsis serialis]|uniref:uncharacterized protein n=1 Tax=Fomitopsis serialis TaxID=139415 RepID=UPI0020083387|nr:uncharacterized protein B0H18DRAFT_986605 [Neoantrodia serialis]KAH9932613.1 hypothetical protein B0H18DRAFT_986605 [Neoantrodia serialis]
MKHITTAVYLFDRCMTIDQEVSHIWLRRYSVVSALYVLLQAVTIIGFSLGLFQQLVDLDCKVTYLVNTAWLVMAMLNDILIAVISALRVYAVNPPNFLAPIVVFVLLFAQTAYEIFEGVTTEAVNAPPPLGCAVGTRSTFSILKPTLTVDAACVAAATVADAIVLVVTWRKTYHIVRLARRENITAGLPSLMLRDGRLLVIINSLSVVLYTIKVFSGFDNFAIAFTSIILSRFFLNLREAALVNVDGSSNSKTQSQSDIHFSRGVGALGATLSFVGDDDGDDEWDANPGDDDEVAAEFADEDREEGNSGQQEISEEARDDLPTLTLEAAC